MPGEQDFDSGTAVEGGVGNGQATGTGHVSDNFDMGNAIDSISNDLGFELPDEEKKTDADPVVKDDPPASQESKPEEKPGVPPVATQDAAPKTWKPEEAAVWAQIPAAAKAAIARREEDMFRGIEQHKQTAQFGNTVQAVLNPYMPILQAHNIDPVENIKHLMNAHYMLATGTMEQKQQMMNQLITDYKIQMPQQQADDPFAPPPDPNVLRLEQEIERLKSGQAQAQQAAYQQKQAEAMQEVNAFAADPKNIYFDEVANDIVKLVNADKALTLAEAYERAVWSNPVTREKEIARQDAEKQAKSREEASAKVASVRKSLAANVQSQPKAGAATLPLGTMDDTMEETMLAIKNRS